MTQIDPEKLFNTINFFAPLTEERFEYYWVIIITGLQKIFAFAFTLIEIVKKNQKIRKISSIFLILALYDHFRVARLLSLPRARQ